MTTEAGKRHIAEFGVGQFGRVDRAVAAIEAEARSMKGCDANAAVMAAEAVTTALTALRAQVKGLAGYPDGLRPGSVRRAAVLAAIDAAMPGERR